MDILNSLNFHVSKTLASRVLLVCVFIARCAGQTCRPADLRVLVRDSQERLIFDAQVRVASESVEVGIAKTPALGLVEFKSVPCGAWTVRVSKEGFDEVASTVQIGNDPV